MFILDNIISENVKSIQDIANNLETITAKSKISRREKVSEINVCEKKNPRKLADMHAAQPLEYELQLLLHRRILRL